MPTWESSDIPTSAARFPDGAAYRIEIPSVEGPGCLDAALEAATKWDVAVTRVSQGSGVMMLTDRELDEMACAARDAGIELSLFARPSASWSIGGATFASAGGVFSGSSHGQAQLAAGVDDIKRAADRGVRSVLIGDLGLLTVFSRLRAAGHLPSDMKAKVSVMLPISNAATAAALAELGADTLNVQTDLTLAELSMIRQAVEVPLDVYVESPDNIGGFVRHHEIPEIIRVAAPVHIKFGLRNAADVYPTGAHLEQLAVAQTVERVRRARLGVEVLQRSGYDFTTSERNAEGLAVPRQVG